MGSSIFDGLNIRLSVLLNDPVGAAGTDGVTYSSALRTEYLNIASKMFWNMHYNTNKGHFRKDNFKIDRFADFINEVTLSSGASSDITVSSYKIAEILQLCHIDLGIKFNVINASEALLAGMSAEKMYYATEQSPKCYLAYPGRATIYVLPNVAAYKSQTNKYKLTYLKYPETYTVNSATELLEWNASFHTSLLKLAMAQALQDDGNQQAFDNYYQSVLNEYVLDIQEMKEVKK